MLDKTSQNPHHNEAYLFADKANIHFRDLPITAKTTECCILLSFERKKNVFGSHIYLFVKDCLEYEARKLLPCPEVGLKEN